MGGGRGKAEEGKEAPWAVSKAGLLSALPCLPWAAPAHTA